jgi:hypothetical protein
MTDTDAIKSDLENSLALHHGIQMFAMANLSEDNPFRPLIEEQTRLSVAEIRDALGHLDSLRSRHSAQST